MIDKIENLLSEYDMDNSAFAKDLRELLCTQGDSTGPVKVEHCLWARNGNTPCPHTSKLAQPTVTLQYDVPRDPDAAVFKLLDSYTDDLGLYEISLEELDALSAKMLEAAVSVKTASETMKRISSETASRTHEAQPEKATK